MKTYKVQTILVRDGKDLEQILNDAVEKLDKRGYDIISIMYIGNNSKNVRLYQVVTKKN